MQRRLPKLALMALAVVIGCGEQEGAVPKKALNANVPAPPQEPEPPVGELDGITFTLVADSVWQVPREEEGATPVKLELHIRNTRDRKVCLILADTCQLRIFKPDGSEIRNGVARKFTKPVTPAWLAKGETHVFTYGDLKLVRSKTGRRLWLQGEDVSGGRLITDRLEAGKYRVEFWYKHDLALPLRDGRISWAGKVKTKPAEIEIKLKQLISS